MAQPETDTRKDSLLQYISGVVRGNTVDTLGLPIDLINTALSPLGLDSKKPVGGSAFFRELFGQPPEPSNIPELLGTLVSVGGLTKAAMLPAMVKQHGTAKMFSEFKKEFYMSGEGAQAFGEGVYTSDKLGKHYAEVAYSANKGRIERNKGELEALQWQLADRFKPGRPPIPPKEIEAINARIKEIKTDQDAMLKTIGKYVMEVELPPGNYLMWESANPDVISKIPKLKELGLTETSTGKEIYTTVQKSFPQASASEILDMWGVRGHIFKDAGSRDSKAKNISTNQVIYDPSKLKVLSTTRLD